MGPHLYLVISCNIMPSYLLTLLSMLLTAFTLSESAPSPCSHQTSPSTSRWHHLVNSNLLTELEVRGSTSATLTMAALPPSLRCEVHEVVRSQRDFIILRHVLHAASYFTTTLNIH